jgi:hypothetical protein
VISGIQKTDKPQSDISIESGIRQLKSFLGLSETLIRPYWPDTDASLNGFERLALVAPNTTPAKAVGIALERALISRRAMQRYTDS